jgi:hypothetical protein
LILFESQTFYPNEPKFFPYGRDDNSKPPRRKAGT